MIIAIAILATIGFFSDTASAWASQGQETRYTNSLQQAVMVIAWWNIAPTMGIITLVFASVVLVIDIIRLIKN